MLPTKNCVDDVVGRLQRSREVVHEGDVEVLELFGEPLRTQMSGLPSGGKGDQRGWSALGDSKHTKS